MARVFSARDRRFGGYLEEYEPGDVYRHWPGKTDHRGRGPHVLPADDGGEPAACRPGLLRPNARREFGRNVVVGTFVYSLLLGMSVPDISGRAIANLGVDELRHVAPLFHGDTLYGSNRGAGGAAVGIAAGARRPDGAHRRLQSGRASCSAPSRARCCCPAGRRRKLMAPRAQRPARRRPRRRTGDRRRRARRGQVSRRFRRRRHQGRGAGRRSDPPDGLDGPGRGRFLFLEAAQPQQAHDRARSEISRGPGGAVGAARRRRRADREHAAGQARGAWASARRAAARAIPRSSSCASAASARTGPMRSVRASRRSPRR